MNYSVDEVNKALEVFSYLLANKTLTSRNDKDLYLTYVGENIIQDIFSNCLQPSFKVKVFHRLDTIYLIPEIDNDFLSHSNEELQKLMSLKNIRQVKLSQFIWLVVIAEFYGEGFIFTGEPNQFVKKVYIVEKVHQYIENLEAQYEKFGDDLSYEFELDFKQMVETWNDLAETTDKTVDKRTLKTFEGFVTKVLNFYEKDAKLIRTEDTDEIILTEKMIAIMSFYYHHDERIIKMTELINRLNIPILREAAQ